MVGSPLGFEKLFNQPAPAIDLGDRSSCAVLFGPTVHDYGRDWRYRLQKARNRRTPKTTLTTWSGRALGLTRTPKPARRAFAAAFPPALTNCNSVAVNNPRDNNAQITWRFDVSSIDGATARWSRVQLNGDQPTDSEELWLRGPAEKQCRGVRLGV